MNFLPVFKKERRTQVTESLGISRNTVYMHLRNFTA